MSERTPEYKRLLDVFVRSVQAMAGQKFAGQEAWMVEAERLATKLFFHLASLLYLRPGTRFEELAGIEVHFFDFASSAVLARACFETYLAFHFIFISPSSADQRHLRYLVWTLGGLLDRQRVTPFTDYGRQRLEEEKKQIEALRTQIQQSPAYADLAHERQKDARRGKWRFEKSWADLAVIAGGSQRYFVGLYAYLSSYAHSGYLSALQVGQAQDKQVQLQLGQMYVGIGLTIMSYFLTDYASLFPPVAAALDASPEDKRLVEVWHLTGADMERMYEGV
ncbi:MAG: hypothetical protein HY271_00125 [Deltaproteobacteria bacterium]|nr:hypothetical protein [Deltaproteobacteria bacterium]